MKNKLVLIDGNSLVYRAFYGTAYVKTGILTNSEGLPVNALLVFAKMINNFLTKYHPSHLLVAFDADKKTKRHIEYPAYKAKRLKTPEELKIQIPLIKEMLNHMQIKHFELAGIEADDIIGTAAKKFQQNSEVLIISSDKDMFQLIDDKISIIFPQNGTKEAILHDINSFENIHGYKPSQVIDVKGLAGDASDNLPGVKGIGEKGAIKLLKQYQSLEGIYENVASINEVMKNKLLANTKNAKLSKKLATIITNVDLTFDFESTSWSFDNMKPSLIDFFKKIEIRSLIKVFEKFMRKSAISNKIFF